MKRIVLVLALVANGFIFSNAQLITSWKTDNPGKSNDNQIEIPTFPGETYNYSVNWGDGNSNANVTGSITHTYAAAGTYTVTITGTFPRIYFNSSSFFTTQSDARKLLTISQWGSQVWTSMENAFAGCTNLTITATDSPNLTSVTNTRRMFLDASSMNSDLSGWNVSNVTNMESMFNGASSFDQNLGGWNVSSVTNMSSMLSSANLSRSNYDALLIGWAQLTLQNNVSFSSTSSTSFYCKGATARQNIINTYNWTINDQGQFCSTETKILTFTLPQQIAAATINTSASTVNIKVPAATSLNSLTPSITFSEGATSNPASGQTVNFASPVTYTVTAEDGTTKKDWTVTVENASNANDITAFQVTGQLGNAAINTTTHTVNAEVLFGTDLTTLAPTISVSNSATISPTSGSSQNFSSPRTYTVTAEDGTTQDWTVTVSTYAGATTGFITTWKTNNTGTSSDNQITIPTTGTGYNYTVNWGDGNTDNNVSGDITHSYTAIGTYTVTITGSFPRIYFNGTGDAQKLLTIQQWGNNRWVSMDGAFSGCSNMTYTATDAPDLSIVESLSAMFSSASSFNGAIGGWDVSNVKNMSAMFANATSFNRSINNWNVGNVTSTRSMFFRATSFNQSLNSWQFNNLEDISAMFQFSNFNGAISSWNVSKVTDMSSFVAEAKNFDQDISSWNVSSVTNMSSMFSNADAFNQDLSSWNVSKVTNMSQMFSNANFNGAIGSWNVSSVTNMSRMLRNNTTFNQNLSSWDVSKVTDMTNMLDNTAISTANYDAMLNAWSGLSLQSNVTLGVAGLTYCSGSGSRTNMTNVYKWIFSGDKACSTEANIVSFAFAEQFSAAVFDANNPVIRILVKAGTNLTSLTPSVITLSNGATISPASNTPQDFSKTVTYKVTAEDGTTTKSWAVIASVVSTGTDIISFSFDQQLGTPVINASNHTVTAELALNTDLSSLTPNIQVSDNATISPASGTAQNFTNNVVYTVTAQDGSTQEWTVSASSLKGATTAFITTWKIENDGSTTSNRIRIPTQGTGYNYTVDWGDGTTSSGLTSTASHTYAEVGAYTVKITGAFPRIYFNGLSEARKLLTIEQWGDNPWTSMERAFNGCSNLQLVATDVPNLAGVKSMERMFHGAVILNADLSKWDVSTIENMEGAFFNAQVFNGNVTTWDVSNVTNMNSMFSNARAFDQGIGAWNVAKVTDMSAMFANAKAFNQDISKWDVSKVTDLTNMFRGASVFNQPIGAWDVSNVTSMAALFEDADAFNQSLSNWNVSKVTSMRNLFSSSSSFNQDISAWDVSAVTNMGGMFAFNRSFNQNITGWNVSNVVQMNAMFKGASAFNQNLGSWKVTSVENLNEFLDNSGLSKSNYESLLLGWSSLTLRREVSLGASGIYYCNNDAARQTIIDGFGWKFFDDGQQCDRTDLIDITFPGQVGMPEIDSRFLFDAKVVVAAGTDLTTLAPTSIVINEAASITPGAGVAQNFSNPVIYTITAEDGVTTKDWKVIVREVSTGNDILSGNLDFSLQQVVDRSNRTLVFHMPFGTNLTSLFPSFQLSENATISPGNSTKQDLSTPVTYTVTSENGVSQEWTVSAVINPPATVPFITTWQTDISNQTNNNQVTISTSGEGYNYTVSWGDGKSDQEVTGTITHTYDTPGTYSVEITGYFPRILVGEDNLNAQKLISIDQWGDNQWTNMSRAFQSCSNMVYKASDVPNLLAVKDMTFMFSGASDFNGNVSSWDVRRVEYMGSIFSSATSFDQSLADWVIENVSDLEGALSFSGLSVENYDKTLIAWSQQDLRQSIRLGASGVSYCSSESARQTILNNFGWTITDDGVSCPVDTDIKSFTLPNQFGEATIDVEAHTVEAQANYLSDLTAITPTVEVSFFSSVSPASGEVVDFTNPVTYTVTTNDDQESQDWVVTVTLGPEPGTDITSFTVPEQQGTPTIDASAHTVDIKVVAETDPANLTPTITVSDGASISPGSEESMDFTNQVVYTVTGSDGIITQDWTVTVEVAPVLFVSLLNDSKVYPNPVGDHLHIELNTQQTVHFVSLTDMAGRVIIKEVEMDKTSYAIQTDILPAGLYLLNLRIDDTIETYRLIKN